MVYRAKAATRAMQHTIRVKLFFLFFFVFHVAFAMSSPVIVEKRKPSYRGLFLLDAYCIR